MIELIKILQIALYFKCINAALLDILGKRIESMVIPYIIAQAMQVYLHSIFVYAYKRFDF